MIQDSIFRAYDVRGVYPNEINEEVAFAIGQGVARYLNAKRLVVGRDGRLSSPVLFAEVIRGITSTGCSVIDLGQTTSPLFYFSAQSLAADGGVMVTASHNPKEYNGFKIVNAKGELLSGANGLLSELKKYMEPVAPAETFGGVTQHSLADDYLNLLLELSGAAKEDLGRVRIVADACNGVSSLELEKLFQKINISVVSMFFDIDGRFPNHAPDISQTTNLNMLSQKVTAAGAAMGFAFDADGDRLAVVDEKGQVIPAEYILGLLYGSGGSPKTVCDVTTSRSVKEVLGEQIVLSKVGHVNMKETMLHHQAGLGGEVSGHFYFKETAYSESSLLAMLKLLVLYNHTHKPLSELVKPFRKYARSEHMRIEVGDEDKKRMVLEKIKKHYADGSITELDGLSVEYADWWFNLRPSNTEPVLRLIIEGITPEVVEQKKAELLDLISS